MLKTLVNIPSPSGFEGNIANYLKKVIDERIEISHLYAFTEIDKYNNLIVTIMGEREDKNIMVDAHVDQIGFMVTNISDKGKISAQYIGGGCKATLSARELTILTKNGSIPAVVNRKHSHLIKDENDETIKKVYDAEIDIGCDKKEEALKHVSIGDPIVYKASFEELLDDNIIGTALDDKTGCYIVYYILYNILNYNNKPKYTTRFTFTCGEETAVTRLKSLIRKYNPTTIYEFDVMFATDYLDGMEKRIGKVELGKGPVIFKGDSTANKLIDPIIERAKEIKIPVQINACGAYAGYNSDGVIEMGYDTDIINVGIPLRNMHSPVEMGNWKDLEYTIKLFTEVIK